MCLAVVYVEKSNEEREEVRDVTYLEADDHGFRIVSLMGEERHIDGRLKSVDFWLEHKVSIEQD
jgi:predicted RNA-binding protein